MTDQDTDQVNGILGLDLDHKPIGQRRARGDSGFANKNKLTEGWKSPCLSHFCGIRLFEKRDGCRVFF